MSAAPTIRGRFQPGQSGNPAGGKPGLMRRRVAALLEGCGATPSESEGLTLAAGDPIVSAAMLALLILRVHDELPATVAVDLSKPSIGGCVMMKRRTWDDLLDAAARRDAAEGGEGHSNAVLLRMLGQVDQPKPIVQKALPLRIVFLNRSKKRAFTNPFGGRR